MSCLHNSPSFIPTPDKWEKKNIENSSQIPPDTIDKKFLLDNAAPFFVVVTVSTDNLSLTVVKNK